MTSQLSLIYTTFSNQDDAHKISRTLLEKRLIACVNIGSEIKSLYFWQERLEEDKEIPVLFKTTSEKVSLAIKILQDLHPYETPAILEIPVAYAVPPFLEWVKKEVR